MSKRPTVLMILDGYGLNDKCEANAYAENTTMYKKLCEIVYAHVEYMKELGISFASANDEEM